MMQRDFRLGLLTAVIVGLGCFVAAEFGLRTVHYFLRGTPITSVLPGYREARFGLSPFLTFGPRLDWQIPERVHPELSYFNHQGFRTTEAVGEKDNGEFRIIALGGSTTENAWNPLGLHWPLVLECHLHDQGFPKVRVLNSGMSAYSSAHSLVRLAFDVLDYEPDLVLVMHNVNDLDVSYRAARAGTVPDGHYLVKYGAKVFTGDLDSSDIVFSRVVHSISQRLLARGRESEGPPLASYSTDQGARLFRRNLGHMVSLSRGSGSEVMLLTMPYSIALAGEESPPIGPGQVRMVDAVPREALARDLARFNDGIREVARETSVPFADMASLFGSSEEYFVDMVHYSSEGIVRFGRLLTPVVADHLEILGIPRDEEGVRPRSDQCAWE